MADAVDLESVKQAQQKIWSEGDFAMIGGTHVIVSELLCEAADVRAGERVLDVACGSGNTTLAAARRWSEAVGLDYVPDLLDRARERAAAERLPVEFIEGDAEALSFDDASFDAVLSTFGAMFAPNQQRAAAELLRVCRAGGRIGMSNWTPEGLVGQAFRLGAEYAPPPLKIDPPTLWGTEERLRELFGDGISSLHVSRREFVFRYRDEEHYVDFFRTYFGPTKAAFERLDEDGRRAYAAALAELIRRYDRGGGRSIAAPSEYLEVVATRA